MKQNLINKFILVVFLGAPALGLASPTYPIHVVYAPDPYISTEEQQKVFRAGLSVLPRKTKIEREFFAKNNPCKNVPVEKFWGVRNCYRKLSRRFAGDLTGKKFIIVVAPVMPSKKGIFYAGGNADLCATTKGDGFAFISLARGFYNLSQHAVSHEVGHLLGMYHDDADANIMHPWVLYLTGQLGFNSRAYRQVNRCEYFRRIEQ